MKRLLVLSALTLAITFSSQAALKKGDHLQAYEIKNTATGEKYCQVCKYGPKAGKIVAFGKLDDAQFWADLKELQALQTKHETLGVFAQIIDSEDASAIQAKAKASGITFPVVIGADDTWNGIYKINGQSRVIYYAHKTNKIAWTSTEGLDAKTTAKLSKRVAKDLKS